MKKLYLFIVFLFAIQLVYSQDGNIFDRSVVHGSFEVDGQIYLPDSALGITDSVINGKVMGLNGFGNITYTLGKFSAGLRYEAYLTPIAGYDPRLEGQGFPNLWASYTDERFSITVGSFYEQFGNGFTLRSYQEWSLGYDNALNGIRVTFEPVKGIILKGIYGVQRFYWEPFTKNSRGIVRGFDGQINMADIIPSLRDSRVTMIFGGNIVSNYQIDADPIYVLPQNVAAYSGRWNLGVGKFNFSGEYAYKINDPSAINNYIYKNGEALLATLTYSTKGFGAYASFKRIDNFSFKSNRNVTANALDISFLPPITDTYTYALASMYPYATQPNGEMAYQIGATYKIPKHTKLGGKYGTGITANFSSINNIQRDPVNDTTAIGEKGTLGYSSPFFAFGEPIYYQMLFMQIDKKFNRKWKGIFQYMHELYDIAVIEGHPGEESVNANIGIADVTYKINMTNAIRLELQGLWTQQDMGNWTAMLLEYTIAPNWFFSIQDQYNYGNPVSSEKLHYFSGSFGYTYKTTRIQFTYGRQREGIVCVGGVCRAVPAATGLSFAISTSF
jgi:hypothetical protein